MEHRSDAAHEIALRHPKGPRQVAATADAVRAEKIEIVFLATPAEVSMELAPAMLAAGARVVDLSGAFRLRTVENYAQWYKDAHTQPALLAEAVYGLPEFCRERIPNARLVANPGCYPTAANLALRPLVEAGGLDRPTGLVFQSEARRERAGTQRTP